MKFELKTVMPKAYPIRHEGNVLESRELDVFSLLSVQGSCSEFDSCHSPYAYLSKEERVKLFDS